MMNPYEPPISEYIHGAKQCLPGGRCRCRSKAVIEGCWNGGSVVGFAITLAVAIFLVLQAASVICQLIHDAGLNPFLGMR